MITAGIDIGSITAKAAALEDGRILGAKVLFTGYNSRKSGQMVLDELIAEIGITREKISAIIATGYGRNSVDFADKAITEITCHASGAHFIDPLIRFIIDIGGQDSKVIRIDENGRVVDFAMNDKCAAGTGRFLEAMSRIFRMDIDEFSLLSLNARKVIPVTAQCSVFAESEVISLLARKSPPEDVAAGINSAVSKRCFSLLKRIGMRPLVTVTGGCAKNQGLIKTLTKAINMEVTTLPVDPQIIGALGAAVFARRNGQG